MNKKFFVLGIVIASVLAFIGLGFAMWGIIQKINSSVEGEFTGYTVIDLDNITNENSKQAFLYNENGLFSDTGLGNTTSFTIQLNATNKEAPYNLMLTLVDDNQILDGAIITSVAKTVINDVETTVSSGNALISISNINPTIDSTVVYLITYTIETNDTTYPIIYSKLSGGQDEFGLRVTATTDNGSWSIDKKIILTTEFQNLMPISKPSIDNTIFTYNGNEQEYNVELNVGYTISGNRQTNAGNYIVTISLNPGYVWSDSTSTDLEYEFIINKDTPILNGTIFVIYPDSRDYGITSDLGLISLSGTFINSQSSNVAGSVSLDNVSNLIVGTSNYNYIFTPVDNLNYNNVTGSVSLVIYATVNFMLDANNILQTNYIQYNGTIEAANIPSMTDEECKTYYSNLLTYQYTPTFSNWISFTSSTVVTTDLTIMPNITQLLRSYNFTIYYKDRDNQVSSVRTNSNVSDAALKKFDSAPIYDFASNIGASIVSNATYDSTTVSLSKQIRLAVTYTYYSKIDTTANRYINAFYMSPVDSFTWSDLATGYSASGYTVTTTKYIAYVEGDDILLLVLCVQPEAIVTTGTISNSTTFNYSTSDAIFFEKMNNAFTACADVTSPTYLRVYGQARCYINSTNNIFSYHCYSSNTSIAKYTYTIDGHTFTIPKYTIYALNDYKLENDYTINPYLTVILPYGRDDTTATGYANRQTSAATYAGSYVQSIMEIPSGITLTVNGTLNVGGWVTGTAGSVGAHATLRNNGTINVTNTGQINSYGYINGAGVVNLESGAILTDVFKINNWPDGYNALGMYYKNLFPFDSYSFHNVSCETNINYGAYYKAWIQIYMSSGWQYAQAQTIIGTGGLFELSSGYIIKRVEDTTYTTNSMLSNASFTVNNQLVTQREVIEIYGNFNDNSISIEILGETISTSTTLPLPIGLLTIKIMSGSGSLSRNSYTFLPGSSLYIEEGSTLTMSSSVKAVFFDETQYIYSYKSSSTATPVLSSEKSTYGYIYLHRSDYVPGSTQYGGFYDATNDFSVISGYESHITVNGLLTCNGYLAGRIDTTGENAQVYLAHNSYDVKQMAAMTYVKSLTAGSTVTLSTSTKYAKLKIYLASGISNIYTNAGSGTYYSIKDSNNNYGFYTTSGTLSYNVNGGNGSFSDVSISITSNGHTITPSEVSNTPTRNHYNFGGWYLDSNCTTLAQGSVVYCSCTLYAKWTPKNYNIVYDFDQLYDGSATDGTETNNGSNPSIYNCESSFALYNPTYGNYLFDGWYSDSLYTTKVSSVIGSSVVESLSSPYTLTLYGRWYPEGTTTYVITYVNDNEDEGCTCAASEEIISINLSSYSPPSLSSKNNNTSYDKYFDGWYLDSEYNTKYSSTSQIAGDTILYAKWLNKNAVTICYILDGNPLTIETRYLQADKSFTIPDISSTLPIPTGYEMQWSIDGGDLDGQIKHTGDTICLSTGWGNEITVTASVVTQSFALSISCGNNESLSYTVYIGNSNNVRTSGQLSKNTSNNSITVYTGDKVSITVTAASGYTIGATSVTNMNGDSSPYIVNGNGNPTITVADANKNSSCLLPNTLVTMANGTYKEIQYLVPGDMIMVFNHETGLLDVAPVTFNEYEEAQWFSVIHLIFDNGKDIGVISEHGFFDLDTMKYEYIDESNYQEFIGHRFYTIDGTPTTLIDAYVEEEYTMCYSLPSYYHLNLFTEDILSMPGGIKGLFNIFEYSETLQYDQELMEQDINTYGLFTIEEFESLGVTEEMFNAYAGKYLKVALGKGILTEEYLMYLIERYGKYTE